MITIGLEMNGIRRKLASSPMAETSSARGAEAAWKLALPRAARDAVSLGLSVVSLRQDRRSLAELLEIPPDRAMIAMLDGPKDALGLMVLSPDVLAGLIEIQTVGRVSKSPALIRKPTRTDAAMIAAVLDKALVNLELMLAHDEDLVWAGGFRYASFLEDTRPLELLLEDVPYRVLTADVSLGEGAKSGQVLFCVPAAGQGQKPTPLPTQGVPSQSMVFAAALDEQVMGASAVLTAVVARVALPIEAVLSLQTGATVPLGLAALDQIELEALGGVRLAGGKLGQNRGMRAIRLAVDALPAAPVKLRPDAKDSTQTHAA